MYCTWSLPTRIYIGLKIFFAHLAAFRRCPGRIACATGDFAENPQFKITGSILVFPIFTLDGSSFQYLNGFVGVLEFHLLSETKNPLAVELRLFRTGEQHYN